MVILELDLCAPYDLESQSISSFSGLLSSSIQELESKGSFSVALFIIPQSLKTHFIFFLIFFLGNIISDFMY